MKDDRILEGEIPSEGSEARTRLAASALHRRERQAYGGEIQWEAALFGWLAAIGGSALLVSLVVGAGLAVGLTELEDPASDKTDALTLGGGVLIFLILALAYLSGGYVAGRMSSFDGWRQGLGVWILGVVAAVGLAVAGLIGGSEYNVLARLDLPRIPVDEGEVTTGGLIALVAVLAGTLAAAIGGGVAGERFHRAVDEAGVSYEEPPKDAKPEETEPEQTTPEDGASSDNRETVVAAQEGNGAR